MDVAVVSEKAFLRGVVEIRAVVDGSDFGGGTAEDFRFPGVEVRVEVDDGDGAIRAIDGAKKGKSNSVITAEGAKSTEVSH